MFFWLDHTDRHSELELHKKTAFRRFLLEQLFLCTTIFVHNGVERYELCTDPQMLCRKMLIKHIYCFNETLRRCHGLMARWLGYEYQNNKLTCTVI